MATFSYIIPYRKEDGTANVRIRILHQRKKKEFTTNIILQPTDFTKGGKIKNYRVLDTLEDMLSTYRKKCVELGLRINNMSVEEVYEYISATPKDTDLDLETYCNSFIAGMKQNTADSYVCAVHSFLSTIGVSKISMSDLCYSQIQEWVDNATTCTNTIRKYAKRIKHLYCSAQEKYNDEDNDIYLLPKNPFRKMVLPKETETAKRAIDVELLRQIYSIELKRLKKADGCRQQNVFARDMFILSFLLVGMNMVDILRCKPMDKEGYISYNRAKTKDNRLDHAYIKIKVPELALPIINKYKGDKDHLIRLNGHSKESTILNVYIPRGMKELSKVIGEKITFYAARHTWATIAVNDCRIDKYTVHLALNHIDKNTSITDVYIKKDFSIIDDANQKVIDFCFGSTL